MPLVGKKKFAYTDQGQKNAYMEAKKTGMPIQNVNHFGNEYDERKKGRVNKPYNLKMGM